MGTRNLIKVIDDLGETKVMQFGGFDGYPSGVGVDLLKFLRNKPQVTRFKLNFPHIRFIEYDKWDEETKPIFGDDIKAQKKAKSLWKQNFADDDLSAEVLTNIANFRKKTSEEILLVNEEIEGFSGGSCDYCYVIDFSNKTFAVHHKLDTPPLKVFNIEDLPDDVVFESDIEEIEEEMFGE